MASIKLKVETLAWVVEPHDESRDQVSHLICEIYGLTPDFLLLNLKNG